jgi:hypothetical protein
VGLADVKTCVFQGMTVQAINGADREQLLRIAKTALRAWPKQNAESDCRDVRSVGERLIAASALLYSRIAFILPGCNTEDSLERFAEGGVGIVADGLCHFE